MRDLLVPCAILLLIAMHGQSRLGRFEFVLIGVAFFYAAQSPLIFLHECGHAIAAWLLRAPPFAVVIGSEPWRMDRNLLGIRWRIGDLWSGGVTYHDPCRAPGARWRKIVILAAGPAVNLAIAVPLLSASGWALPRPSGSPGSVALFAIALASAFQFVYNLWPRDMRSAIGRIASDGARILALLRASANEVGQSRGVRRYFEALFAFGDGDYRRALALVQDAEPRVHDAALRLALAQLKSAARKGTWRMPDEGGTLRAASA